MSCEKIPEDLGIKIGSKLEVFWTNVLKTAKASLEESEYNMILQKEVIILAEGNIELEEKKMKKHKLK